MKLRGGVRFLPFGQCFGTRFFHPKLHCHPKLEVLTSADPEARNMGTPEHLCQERRFMISSSCGGCVVDSNF